jgi:uncharacterized hydrophobic protein (TIGR00271 family)
MKFKLKDLTKRAIEEIKPDEDLIILTIISVLIAGFAIYMDNVPLLIGSMLIGPFFDPILSIVVLGSSPKQENKIWHAVASLLLMVIIGLAVGVFQFLLIRYFTDFKVVDVVSSGFLVSFIVAILLGAVGMFLWVWPKTSNTSAGVAIAISLVPPLVNVSIGLVYCNLESILYYGSMFLINTCGILVGSFMVLQFLVKKNSEK